MSNPTVELTPDLALGIIQNEDACQSEGIGAHGEAGVAMDKLVDLCLATYPDLAKEVWWK